MHKQRMSAQIVAARHASFAPRPLTALYPSSRRRPGLARTTFFDALTRSIGAEPEERARVVRPVGLLSAFEAFVELLSLVGAIAPYAADSKATTLIKVEPNAVRLIHRRWRSKDVTEKAGELLEDVLAAFGMKVRIRELMHEPNMSGWAAVLRLAPVAQGRGFAPAM